MSEVDKSYVHNNHLSIIAVLLMILILIPIHHCMSTISRWQWTNGTSLLN